MKYFYEDKSGTFSSYMGSCLDFDPHLHGHVEIVAMIRGCATGFVESRQYEITPGDIFVVFPNQIHFYESHMDEQYIILLFPPEITDEFSYLFNQKIPEQALIRDAMADAELAHALYELHDLLKVPGSQRPAAALMRQKGYFLVTLGHIFEKLRLIPADPRELATVNLILNYCMTHFGERLRLEDVADALHINKYYISHLFRQKLSMGFGDYVRTLRVGQACRLLERRSMSITEVAYGVGFSSTRTFNRAFARYTGMTPREYQKKHRQAHDEAKLIFHGAPLLACDRP